MAAAAAYLAQLQALLPQGAAWSCAPEADLTHLLEAIAQELARIDARDADLIEEADPRTTTELLPDWERLLGLPDACAPAGASIADRRLAVVQKLTSMGGQSVASFTAIGEQLGYRIEIIEYRPLRAGFRAGDPSNDADWSFVWVVEATNFDGSQAEPGQGGVNLECVIGRTAPAHTIVGFTYPAPPEPLIWFDFLEP